MDARTVKGRRTAHKGAGVVQPVKKGRAEPGNMAKHRRITQDAQEV